MTCRTDNFQIRGIIVITILVNMMYLQNFLVPTIATILALRWMMAKGDVAISAAPVPSSIMGWLYLFNAAYSLGHVLVHTTAEKEATMGSSLFGEDFIESFVAVSTCGVWNASLSTLGSNI